MQCGAHNPYQRCGGIIGAYLEGKGVSMALRGLYNHLGTAAEAYWGMPRMPGLYLGNVFGL